MGNLLYGSAGSKVKELQGLLNALLPDRLPPLAVDGKFGSKTRARVVELQQKNGLVADGIVGPLTMTAILELMKLLGVSPPAPPSSSVTVRSITQAVLGMQPTNGLISQIFPTIPIIDVATFKQGVASNAPQFRTVAMKVGRMGIFAAGKDGVERAVILVVPAGGANRVLIGISHGFAQNTAYYNALGWQDPLSPGLIQDVMFRHVIKRWGVQTLAAKKPMALFHIVRAAGVELGPFANDGAFVREALEQTASLTGNAFSFGAVEAFTYSSGISDFNPFIASVAGHLNVAGVYNIDPAHATSANRPASAFARQYLSGMTGGPRPLFEYMPLQRWKNDPFYYQHKTAGTFQYLHNFTMPGYTLYLGIQTS